MDARDERKKLKEEYRKVWGMFDLGTINKQYDVVTDKKGKSRK